MSTTQAGGDSRTDQAKETAQHATEQAKQTAEQATQQARGRVRDEVDRRSTEAGQQASSVADAFRQSAQQLRQEGKEGVAKPVEQVADRVQQAGSWLERSSGDDILREVEDFGRSKPLAVLAGGAVVGFALSRLLKASSTKRYQESSSAGGYGGQAGRSYGGGYGGTTGYGPGGTGTTTGPYGSPTYGDGERLPATTPEPPISRPAPAPGAVSPEPPRGPGSF
jgi:vacuolar-type H+-ATPase subunit E/Vma4